MRFWIVAVFWLGASWHAHASESRFTFRIFDVRQLTEPVPDRPGPDFSLSGTTALAPRKILDWEVGLGEGPKSAVMDEDRLLTTIREMEPSVDWEEEGVFLRVHHGRLYARHDPKVLQKLETFLATLESLARRSVCVRVLAFGPPFPALPEKGILGKEERVALTETLRKKAGWSEEITVTGLNGQRMYASKGTQFLHLAEMDPDVAQGARLHDPVMAVGNLGIVLDVRVLASPSGDAATLTLRLSCALPLSDKPVRTVETPGGKIQAPAIWNTAIQATVSIPAGGAVLLGSHRSSAKEGGSPASTPRGIRVLVHLEPLFPETSGGDRGK
jgi:hypothetical protein